MFYSEYFDLDTEKVTEYKIKYLKSIITDNHIYKFISFDDNRDLNTSKLSSLREKNIWFSYYDYLNDSTEFQIDYSIKKICNKTNFTKTGVKNFIDSIKELYDICSFSYENTGYMWETYANKGNGICLTFEVLNYDYLFPIDYKTKKEIDFTKMIIRSINYNGLKLINDPMAIYPFVVKNIYNGKMDSSKEKELRILYSAYDYSEFNNGILAPSIKKLKKYKGINVKYNKVGLALSSVLIGMNCNSEIINSIEKICVEQDIKSYATSKT